VDRSAVPEAEPNAMWRKCEGFACRNAASRAPSHLLTTGSPLTGTVTASRLNASNAPSYSDIRKYATLINHGSWTSITTLGYFRSLIDEIDQLNASPDYWQYVTIPLADLERRWRKQHNRPARGHEPEKTK
jgi:hypothetical protein